MRDGFIKVACGIPQLTVADVNANLESIKEVISVADSKQVNLLVMPELCITGYTCGDLFFSDSLIEAAKKALIEIAEYTVGRYPIILVGLPIKHNLKLFNCAAVIANGKILGIVPKDVIPNHNEFFEKRYFACGSELSENAEIILGDRNIPFGCNLLFKHNILQDYTFGTEICEDVLSAHQKAEDLALSGANIIANLSASSETVGKSQYRKNLISATSERLICGYIYTSSSVGESTQDSVYSGHCLIYENGVLLNENKPFEEKLLTVSEIDVKLISNQRIKNTGFVPNNNYRTIDFSQEIENTILTRNIPTEPFGKGNEDEIAETVLQIQSCGLARRIAHTNSKKAVIGISGGLDSTLALLVTVRTMKHLGRPLTDILAITMPCFGTTDRTLSNSQILCNLLGVEFKEINITEAVKQHFKDISQPEDKFDVTFENSQARERTQLLMDIANMENGLVIGTGDLSELALGWATYNGDHMSMYAVNASVPKTLIRNIVKHEANNSDTELKNVLYDILDTPISPELLPSNNDGDISQKTENLVGPYELHDFFLYHMVKYGEGPRKILRLAIAAFKEYTPETILHWLKIFTRRFFSQQFKRSCMPDGPKVLDISLSPRSDWKMPSDAVSQLWLSELDEIKL